MNFTSTLFLLFLQLQILHFTLQDSQQTVAHSHGHTVTVSYSSQVTSNLKVLFDFCQVVFASFVSVFRRIMCGDVQCKENPIYVFLFWELRSLSPNVHLHVSVSDLYIPRIGPHISLQQNRHTDPGIYKSITDI